MALGPLMVDLLGLEPTPEEREVLCHPLVGGVILFTRNYASPEQLEALVAAIHALRSPPLLVAVDHEGGAVQRFRDGFTQLPACALFGRAYDREHRAGLRLAEDSGWLMAAELRAAGVDFSFAPVLDLGVGISRVINDRAFHRDPAAVAGLGAAYVRGMRRAGMAAVGKHFPGHGSVAADSHHEVPVDGRRLADIEQADLVPFRRLIEQGLPGIMPAHVIYPEIDPRPAGFSPVWLRQVLRSRYGYQGAIFSDDISMAGAAVAGDALERTRSALAAGCDMVLVCNDPQATAAVIERLGEHHEPLAQVRLMRMHGRGREGRAELQASPEWSRVRSELTALGQEPELNLGDDETA